MIFKKEFVVNSSDFAGINLAAARQSLRRLVVLLGASMIFSFAAAVTVQAATFTVTKVANTNDGVCDADCSLREAITRASAEQTSDVINFAPALFTMPQTMFVTEFFLVNTGTGALTIDGPGAHLLTLRSTSNRVINVDRGILTVNGVTITGGEAIGGTPFGGGIHMDRGFQLTINNCVITGNSAERGGGIHVSAGQANINNSTISNNTARLLGGGISTSQTFSGGDSTVVINNSTINGNKVTEAISNTGGGGIAFFQTAGSLTITNSTISGNQVGVNGQPGTGGGILTATGTTNLINVTIARNFASEGGGVYVQAGTVFARNSLFGDNFSSSSFAIDFTGRLDSQGYNLLETMPSTIFGNQTGNIYGQDPRLAPLADNGGATFTHALMTGSPAIDAADPANFPPIDQRGLARPADGDANGSRIPDIGAFEHSAAPPYRPFDFDGDGRADVSVYRPTDGTWYLLRSTHGFTGVRFGISTDKIVPADYDGDGRTDVAVYRPSDGVWYTLQSTQGFKAFSFGLSEDIPVPGDFDGDGKANLAVFRPSTGSWYIARATGTPSQNFDTVPFGANGDKPIAGADFDGDAKADVAVFRPSNGYWYRLNSSNGQFAATQFGIAEDKPVAADYDGDGKADIAVWRPSDGVWYLLQSGSGLFAPIQFGASGDVPVPADYDGDGKANLAVFRPSTNSWYIARAFGGSSQNFDTVVFGVGTDKPVPGAFVP